MANKHLEPRGQLETRIRELEAENASLRELLSARPGSVVPSPDGYHLRSILDNMPSMIGYWDNNLRNGFGNHAYLDWLGVDPATMPGRHIREVIGEERYQMARPYIEAALRGERQHFELAISSPDGQTTRYALADYTPNLVDGQVLGFYVMVTDITSIKRAEAAIRDSEARYRAVVADQTEVISRILPDGSFVFANDVFCRTFGKSVEELLGQRWHPVAHPDDLGLIEARLREMSPENPVVIIENRVFVADGELRWMQFVNRGFFDDQGALREIQSVGRDITSLKQIEAELRESKARLDAALTGSGLACWDWDLQNHEVTGDDRWPQVLGYASDELGRDENQWLKLIDPRDRANFDRTMMEYLQGDASYFQSEHRMRHKNGHWVTVEARGKLTQQDPGGDPLRMVGTIFDVSQRKRLHDEGLDLLRQIESLIRENASIPTSRPSGGEALEALTKRERQVLEMIAGGMTSAQIGEHLQLSTNTITTHRKNLMAKLDLHTMAEVTRFAIDHDMTKSKR